MRSLRYAVGLIVVVDFLVAVVQMQQAIIERASFQKPSVTTYGQYAVTMTSKTRDPGATSGITRHCSQELSPSSTTRFRALPIR